MFYAVNYKMDVGKKIVLGETYMPFFNNEDWFTSK